MRKASSGEEYALAIHWITRLFFGALTISSEEGLNVVPFAFEESIYFNCVGALGTGLPCINEDGSASICLRLY